MHLSTKSYFYFCFFYSCLWARKFISTTCRSASNSFTHKSVHSPEKRNAKDQYLSGKTFTFARGICMCNHGNWFLKNQCSFSFFIYKKNRNKYLNKKKLKWNASSLRIFTILKYMRKSDFSFCRLATRCHEILIFEKFPLDFLYVLVENIQVVFF